MPDDEEYIFLKENKHLGNNIILLTLGGSHAYGMDKEDSDIDICVKLQEPDYFTRMEIKESLEERFNAKVDVVSLTAIMRSLFRNHIEKDAIYI